MHKIKRSHLYLTFFAIVLFESCVLNRIRINDVQPDLLLIGILFFSLFFDFSYAIEAALVGGLLRDILTSGFFGINAILFGAVATLISFSSDKIYKDFFLTQIVLTAVVGLCLYTTYFFLRFIIFNGDIEYLGNGLTGTILPSVIYTSFISPVVFFVLASVFRIRERT